MNIVRVYMHSLDTRQSNLALSKYVCEAVNILKAAEFDLIILIIGLALLLDQRDRHLNHFIRHFTSRPAA